MHTLNMNQHFQPIRGKGKTSGHLLILSHSKPVGYTCFALWVVYLQIVWVSDYDLWSETNETFTLKMRSGHGGLLWNVDMATFPLFWDRKTVALGARWNLGIQAFHTIIFNSREVSVGKNLEPTEGATKDRVKINRTCSLRQERQHGQEVRISPEQPVTHCTVDRHVGLKYKGYIAKKMTRQFHTRPKLSSCV